MDLDSVHAPVDSRRKRDDHASTWFLLSRLEPYPTCQNLKSCLPYWFTTSQWRLQFPHDKVCKTITLKSIKSGVTPNKNIKVCPDWVGAKKKGRPKKAQRQLGVADFMAKAATKKGGKRKKSNEGDTMSCLRLKVTST